MREYQVDPVDAVPGRWYLHPRWGKMLCAGTSDKQTLLPAFVWREKRGESRLAFLSASGGLLKEAVEQSWQDELSVLASAE